MLHLGTTFISKPPESSHSRICAYYFAQCIYPEIVRCSGSVFSVTGSSANETLICIYCTVAEAIQKAVGKWKLKLKKLHHHHHHHHLQLLKMKILFLWRKKPHSWMSWRPCITLHCITPACSATSGLSSITWLMGRC